MCGSGVLLLLLASCLLVSEGRNVTVDMEVLEQTGAGWEGRFCFNLPTRILGYEMIVHFNASVKQITQYDFTVLSPSNTHTCSSDLRLVNKNGHGVHPAGRYCVKMAGIVCGPDNVTAQATLVDLTADDMQPPAVPILSGAASMKYNYPEVLQKSILFYEAQRSGKLPADNRVPWRGDSATDDHGQNGEDLSGGWYDAGDNIKYNFPMASSVTALCWGFLEFQDAYSQAGQLDYMYDSLRWPLEYFIKCHTGPNELYVQVGSTPVDHNQWTRPEAMAPNRRSFKVDATHPGSDVAMEMAAAMACGSIMFQIKDANFSAQLLSHAKEVYDFGKNHPGPYHTTLPDQEVVYRSGGIQDESHWGALWLYKATEDQQYLQDASSHYDHSHGWAFSWDEKIAGNHLLMYEQTEDAKYVEDLESYMNLWFSNGTLTYTPRCLAWRQRWGSLRYSANTAFIALLAAKKGIHTDQYRQWAMCQIHYSLGDTGRSYVVGYGAHPPTHIHHRGSTCPLSPAPCGWDVFGNPNPNPHVLYGALVGGPDEYDNFVDHRDDYVHNEVACDYNAGFQGAVAALLQLAIDNTLPDPDQCFQC